METLEQKYRCDEKVWDECASTYEDQIVCGHPDILAFEEFEEDLFDRLLAYLASTQDRPLKLMDIGCGSGRLHIRYGCRTADDREVKQPHPVYAMKKNNHTLSCDSVLRQKLMEVWGIDFSARMIELAESKVESLGLRSISSANLTLEKGSAFELEPQSDEVLPVAVCLVNSIGVMQGPEGAVELFKSMRRAVEKAGGIAIISCYQREYISSYGLGQYESTLDVSGQPAWMMPDTYASGEHVQVAGNYKRAHSTDTTLTVDVFDANGNLVKKGHVLRRDPEKTSQTIETGRIRTYGDYKSHWYSFDIMEEWKNAYWPTDSYHIKTKSLDALRAEPAQMAIMDPQHHLDGLFKRWNLIR